MAESLPIPAFALTDPDSLEIARIWVANGSQHVSLAEASFQDPAAWGEFLIDFIAQVADSYAAQGRDRDGAMARIIASFEKQIRNLNDQPSDGIVDL